MRIVYLVLLMVALCVITLLIGGTRPVWSLPAYGLLGVAGVATIASAWRRSDRMPGGGCIVASALFFGYIIWRALASREPYLARLDLYMVLAALIVYGLVGFYLQSTRDRGWLLALLLLLSLGHVTLGVVQFAKGNNYMLWDFTPRADYGSRASGFYICPNHLAGYLEIVLSFGLSLLIWGRMRPTLRLLTAYICGVSVVGILLSLSRGGYLSTIAMAAVIGVMTLLSLRSAGRSIRLWIVLGAVVLGLLAVPAALVINRSVLVKARMGQIYDPANMRLTLWDAALQQWREEPAWGTGSRTFLYYGREFRAPGVTRDPVYTHNDYLQLLGEYGAVGAGLFLIFLVAHVWRGLLGWRWVLRERFAAAGGVSSNSLALNIGAFGALAAMVVHSVFDFNLHIPGNTLLMAAVFAILANPGMPERPPLPGRMVRHFGRFALPVLGGWLLVAALPQLPGEYHNWKAQMALNSASYEEAAASARAGLKWDDENPELHGKMGEALSEIAGATEDWEMQRQLFSEAVGHFERALALAPGEVWLQLGMGWALDALQRYEEATPYFQMAMELEPNSHQTHFYHGVHRELSGEREEAKRSYEKSLEIYSNVAAEQALQRLAEGRAFEY